MPQFSPPTFLTDGVVTLRPWRDDDAGGARAPDQRSDVAAFLDLVPQPYTLADAREWFVIEQGRLAQRNVGDVRDPPRWSRGAVGGVGIRFLADLDESSAEVGYWVGADARGRGVATAGDAARRQLGVRGGS